MIIVGVDTGGTFTDFVLVQDNQLTVHKVLSTPYAPEQAILQGLQELGLHRYSDDVYIIHGSTVATNAVLEGKGVTTAYITNLGLADVLTIGRQARKELYNLQPRPSSPPVPRELCLETGGRLAADGQVIEPLTELEVEQLHLKLQQLAPKSVAINLLFSFLDDQFEQRIARAVPEGIFVSLSSQILPEAKEYERGITTWLNASVGPIVQGYLARLLSGIGQLNINQAGNTQVSVMQSSGGTIEAAQAGRQAVQLLLSGPAGGLAGAKFIGDCAGHSRLLSFDMGGTSTDVALIDGQIVLTSEGRIGDYPVSIPMVDMHTIGAGGGSIACVDKGGLLQVGPGSAGADPGPACYGKNGTHATVTDANLMLGRLRPDLFLGGKMSLDCHAAHIAIERLAKQLRMDIATTAQGIIKVVNEHMARALRVMSVQRGLDPRELTLVCFGGAGGLHVCALADALAMRKAIVPVNAGVLSALGMLVAPRARNLSHSLNKKLLDTQLGRLQEVFEQLTTQGRHELEMEGLHRDQMKIERSVDLRYVGQSYCINVPWRGVEKSAELFHDTHKQRYGHALTYSVELVTARVRLTAKNPEIHLNSASASSDGRSAAEIQKVSLIGIDGDVNVYLRDALTEHNKIQGPALIAETVSTTYLAPGWLCQVDRFGNLLLDKQT